MGQSNKKRTEQAATEQGQVEDPERNLSGDSIGNGTTMGLFMNDHLAYIASVIMALTATAAVAVMIWKLWRTIP